MRSGFKDTGCVAHRVLPPPHRPHAQGPYKPRGRASAPGPRYGIWGSAARAERLSTASAATTVSRSDSGSASSM